MEPKWRFKHCAYGFPSLRLRKILPPQHRAPRFTRRKHHLPHERNQTSTRLFQLRILSKTHPRLRILAKPKGTPSRIRSCASLTLHLPPPRTSFFRYNSNLGRRHSLHLDDALLLRLPTPSSPLLQWPTNSRHRSPLGNSKFPRAITSLLRKSHLAKRRRRFHVFFSGIIYGCSAGL